MGVCCEKSAGTLAERLLGMPEGLEQDILDALTAQLHVYEVGELQPHEDFHASAVSQAFCDRIEAVLAFAEAIQSAICGTGSTTIFCQRLTQTIAAARALKNTFCMTPPALPTPPAVAM